MAAKEIAVKKYVVRLSTDERAQLKDLIHKGKRSAQLLTKARILLKADVSEVGEGWIQQLATEANHRHRGIATALLGTAFAGFRERGRTRAGVSTDSRTGALDLYERVGMRVERSYTRYTKRLT